MNSEYKALLAARTKYPPRGVGRVRRTTLEAFRSFASWYGVYSDAEWLAKFGASEKFKELSQWQQNVLRELLAEANL